MTLGVRLVVPAAPMCLHLSERTQILPRSARMLRRRRLLVLYSSLFPPPLAAITSCHLRDRSKRKQASCHSQVYENKETWRQVAVPLPWNHAKYRKFRESRESEFGKGAVSGI